MKWKSSEPKDGDKRTRRVFAWRKTKIGDYIVWLETYEIDEIFYEHISTTPGFWSEIKKRTLEYDF
jgi:hypothetical protein